MFVSVTKTAYLFHLNVLLESLQPRFCNVGLYQHCTVFIFHNLFTDVSSFYLKKSSNLCM